MTQTNNLPSGTVTFLFTDIEDSTKLWEQHPQAMRAALAHHDSILREAIESHNGHIIKTTGDGVHAVFNEHIKPPLTCTGGISHCASAWDYIPAKLSYAMVIIMGRH
jgi:class 3 adenylate cyclase